MGNTRAARSKDSPATKGKPKGAGEARSKAKAPAKMATGRPPKFTEPETMGAKVDAYFTSLAKGRGKSEPPTMAGLALALGFLDRQSLRDYSERTEAFSCVVKKACLQIQAFHEKRLSGQYPTGSIFWLKNHSGYADRTELSGPGGGPFEVVTLTPEQRDARIAEILAKAKA